MATATLPRADTDSGPDTAELEEVLRKLTELRSHIMEREREWEPQLEAFPEENRRSAINLVRYLALRESDLRELQEVLSRNGLSSLGRAEPRVLSNLEAVIRVLYRLVHGEWPTLPENERALVRLKHTTKLLRARTEALFGPAPAGRLAVLNAGGIVQQPARIPCTLPEALDRVQRGERIWFDDGRIGGVIKSVQPDEVLVEITAARPTGDRLRADKGINLPDSRLDLPSLSPLDLAGLAFIARHAEIVGYSFVRSAADVVELQEKLAEVGGAHLGIVLKIETREAFEQLPSMLFAAMRGPAVGIMIARGDLAVETGFARLAEVQEEILWLGEAAHVPVIWATQVLERLAKDGRPSRAEVTDAAIAERAECVMLNKGPFVVDAVRALDSILVRMQGHQEKKRSLLRPLRLAETFFAAGRPGESRGLHGA